MMDSIKQDLKVVEEEEDQYEKDMKLQVGKRFLLFLRKHF